MIDISNLTSLITAFRQETEQGSISPETVGALLQAISDELANVSTDQETIVIKKLQENFKALGSFLVSVAQGDTDRNNVLANFTLYNPNTGVFEAQRGVTFIKQATTERAGAMRAQQVIDLNACKKDISNLQTSVNNISATTLSEVIKTFGYADGGGSIAGYCFKHGSICTIVGTATVAGSVGSSSVSQILPFPANDSFCPKVCIYDEDSMQWVKIYIYNDLNGTHIAASIPEDFMRDDDGSVKFSLSYIIKT